MTSVTKLLIIHDRVKDYQTFINSRLDDTQYIVMNGKDLETDFRDKTAGFDLSGLINVGLVFENTGYRSPFFEYTAEELALEKAKKAEYDAKLEAYKAEIEKYRQKRELVSKSIHPSLPFLERISPAFYGSGRFFSNGMMSVLRGLKDQTGSLQFIDIISCNIRDSKQFAELLALGLTVRYSTDITGQGGDWILESHDVNITPIYFTDAVREYRYRLGGIAPTSQDGDGNWLIENPDNLYWLMTTTATSADPAPNLGSFYKLTNNIDMSTYSDPAQSIGLADLFSGIFDGNNKIITIKDIDTTYVGFFYISNSTITRTNINYINGFNMSISASEAACFITNNSGGNITNSTVKITGGGLTMNGGINGGFCGTNIGTIGSGCTVEITGDVNMNANLSMNGGFCGYNTGGTIGLGCTVEITGDVNMNANLSSNGGFCGTNIGTIDSDCTVTITRNVNMLGISTNGGFCGDNNTGATIGSGCTVEITGDFNMNAADSTNGGFCGYNAGSTIGSSATFNGSVLFEVTSGSTGYIGSFVGYDNGSGTYTNCSVSYNSTTVFKNKATTPYIASPIGNLQLTESPNITVTFGGTPFYFYNDSPTSIIFNDTIYNIGDVFIYNNLSISITDLTVTIEIIPPVPSVLTNESYDIPCCTPLIPCDVNPQTGDNDYTEINTKLNGQTLGRNVDSVYRDINRGTGALFATPAFKSYRDYMAYLQSKLR
jgi:hypothetical protein